ncbi:LysR family transcriptional regulator [Citrobacter gillenii]|uniref:helix-turn-helix domain-containing protein n=1 Tax=Citrobacter gillenii TaxID=67828 RepID=UPI0039889E0E
MDLINYDSRLRHLMDVDFRSILTFIVFVDTGSLYGASLVLGCSASSISLHLKRVRSYFNDILFIREGRNLNPTEYAVELSHQLKLAFYNLDTVCHGESAVVDCELAIGENKN